MRGRQKSSVRAQVEFRGLIENAENLKNIESAKRDLGGESKRNRGGGGGGERGVISFPLELNLPVVCSVCRGQRRPQAVNTTEYRPGISPQPVMGMQIYNTQGKLGPTCDNLWY